MLNDFLFLCQVSRLQVAELVAAAVANPELAENKVSPTLLGSPKFLSPSSSC